MGIVRMGIPHEIVLFIKELTHTDIFVETGTFHGWTSFWASQYFKQVKTIEFSKIIYDKTVERHKSLTNIDFIYGDSRIELGKIVNNSTEPMLFWLDAHWCGSDSYGEDDQCPLINELNIIYSSNLDHIVFVDDARLFLAPPTAPSIAEQYPTITDIILSITKYNLYIVSFEDVIIFIPQKYKKEFIPFLQQKIAESENLIYQKKCKEERITEIKRFIKKISFYKYWRK